MMIFSHSNSSESTFRTRNGFSSCDRDSHLWFFAAITILERWLEHRCPSSMVLGAQNPVGGGGNSREGEGASLGNFQLKDSFLQSSRWVAGIKLNGKINYAEDLLGAVIAVKHLSNYGAVRYFADARDSDAKRLNTKLQLI